jgi:hypothetical protein
MVTQLMLVPVMVDDLRAEGLPAFAQDAESGLWVMEFGQGCQAVFTADYDESVQIAHRMWVRHEHPASFLPEPEPWWRREHPF